MTGKHYTSEMHEELHYLESKYKRYQTMVDLAQRHSNIEMLVKYINKRDAVYNMYLAILANI